MVVAAGAPEPDGWMDMDELDGWLVINEARNRVRAKRSIIHCTTAAPRSSSSSMMMVMIKRTYDTNHGRQALEGGCIHALLLLLD